MKYEMMKDAKGKDYAMVIEYSGENKCFIGRCPGLFSGGVHGDDPGKVVLELRQAIEEWIANLQADGKPLPAPTAGKTYSGKFVVRIPSEVHQKLVLNALAKDESLNEYVTKILTAA
ncbi:MAG: type II toxin-antitoxin system HicB family antitoxin [Opitutaceae bacterium]